MISTWTSILLSMRRAVIKGHSWLFVLIVLLATACAPQEQESGVKGTHQVKSIPVGKGPDALFLTPDERFLYVANVEDTVVSVIDTRSDSVVKTLDTVDYPWGFVRLGESNRVAVSGWNKGVDIIDFSTHKIVRSQTFKHHLGGITATNDGSTLFVVATEANKVLKLDAVSLQVLDEFATGNGPDGIGISGSNRYLYVTNTKDGTISVIEIASKKSQLIETGGKPELVHSNQEHSLLFVSNFLLSKVHIIDAETGKIVDEITSLDGPEEAVLSKNGEILYVVNFNSSKVYAYDAKTYSKLEVEYTAGQKPIGVVSAQNDSKLYVTNYGDNAVSVIDLK